jgi:hypothetical protein
MAEVKDPKVIELDDGDTPRETPQEESVQDKPGRTSMSGAGDIEGSGDADGIGERVALGVS